VENLSLREVPQAGETGRRLSNGACKKNAMSYLNVEMRSIFVYLNVEIRNRSRMEIGESEMQTCTLGQKGPLEFISQKMCELMFRIVVLPLGLHSFVDSQKSREKKFQPCMFPRVDFRLGKRGIDGVNAAGVAAGLLRSPAL